MTKREVMLTYCRIGSCLIYLPFSKCYMSYNIYDNMACPCQSVKMFQSLPSEQNENMCRVCRTFCLACLQNNFPVGKQWGK